jgi:hypothetical protein
VDVPDARERAINVDGFSNIAKLMEFVPKRNLAS